jgi:hypothetical protein
MIVVMDWLQLHSPMLVHWTDKWLIVPYQGTTIKLFGLQPGSIQCSVMEVSVGQSNDTIMEVYLAEDISEKDQSLVQALSVPLQSLLIRFSHVFAVPHGLPPAHDCNHQIPLIPSA